MLSGCCLPPFCLLSHYSVSPLTLCSIQNPSTYCQPFEKDENGLPIAPCGAVANSIFNGKIALPLTTFIFHIPLYSTSHCVINLFFVIPDSFTLVYHGSKGSTIHVPLYRSGLTWYTDKNIKYRNPKMDNLTLAQVFEGKSGRDSGANEF